ncbi:MAG: hypothetical protein ABIH34_01645 [Nanoarchaeota archaeon]
MNKIPVIDIPEEISDIRIAAVLAETSFTGRLIEPIHKKIIDTIASKKYGLVIAPELSYCPPRPILPGQEHPALTIDEKNHYLNELLEATDDWSGTVFPGTMVYNQGKRQWNDVFGIQEGMVVHRHTKRRPQKMEWHGKELGVVICAEDWLTPSYWKDLSLIVKVSCGNAGANGIEALHKDGIMVVVDGYHQSVNVYKRRGEDAVAVFREFLQSAGK